MRRVPGLERCNLDLNAVRSGHTGHPRVRLDPDDRAAPGEEQACHLAGSATNVEHSRRLAGQQVVDQRNGVRRARPIVALGVFPEGLRPAAILMVFRYQVGPGWYWP